MEQAGSVLERLLRPADGDVPPDYARRMLAVDFTDADRARDVELSEKAGTGEMTAEEHGELEQLVIANDLLALLHLKARASLRSGSAA